MPLAPAAFPGLGEILALAVFNLPVAAFCGFLARPPELHRALCEKGPGSSHNAPSYSRISGALGSVVLAAFFWATGNMVITMAFADTAAIRPLLDNAARYCLIGSALFAPYAVRQLRSQAQSVRNKSAP